MIDVIVTNYRTNNDLFNFIESFRQTAPSEAVLTVVDVDPVFPYDYRDVPGTLIRTKDNNGYAYACNLAVAETEGDVIGLFNADVKLLPGTVEKCAQALRENPSWGAVGPLQYDYRSRVTHGGILGTNNAPVQRGWQKRLTDEYREVRDDAVMVMGSAFFMRREVWDELTNCPIYQDTIPGATGAFLPTFLYYEETWCSYHVGAHGYKNVFLGTAECIHEWHKSIKKHGDNKAFHESQALFRKACDNHNIIHD